MKKYLCMIEVVAILIISCVSGMQISTVVVDAKDTNAKAKAAYNSLLKKEKYKEASFCLVDMNQNGIDELVISFSAGGYEMNSFWEVYTYFGDKLQKVAFPEEYAKNYYLEYGFYPAYNPKTMEFAADPQGGSMLYMCTLKLKGNKFVKKHEFSWYHESCYYDDKEVSVEEMEKIYKKYSEDYCLKGISNTAKNRKLYLENKKDISINVGDSKKIGLAPQFTKNISYKSSDAKIAKVDKKGKITAKKAGKAEITVKVQFYGHSEKYTITVTVKKAQNSYGIEELNYKGDMSLSVKKCYEKNGKYYVQGSLNSIDFDNFGVSKKLKDSITFELRKDTKIYVWVRTKDGGFDTKKLIPKDFVEGSKDSWIFADITSCLWYIKVKDGRLISIEQLWI